MGEGKSGERDGRGVRDGRGKGGKRSEKERADRETEAVGERCWEGGKEGVSVNS